MAIAAQPGSPDGRLQSSNDGADPEAVLISLRLGGHAGASGYDRLQEYLDCRLIRPPAHWSLAQRTLARSLRFMNRRSGSTWYHRDSLLGELCAAGHWLRRKGQVFHFLYGENSYRYLGALKSLGTRNAIVSTYHTPPDKFVQVVKDRRHLSRLDAIIVVSTMQAEFFSTLVGPDRVIYVPHGIDVAYFKPGGSSHDQREEFRCLFVGSHLRDFDTLANTARLLGSDRNLRFTVVTRPDNLTRFSGMTNVTGLSGVNDQQLLALYQDSDLLVLPLLECTANNSLLEALACGLPIVTTDLQGARDYVNAECAVLTPKGDAQQLAEAIVGIRQDRDGLRRMARASRLRAMELCWEAVAARMIGVYRNLGQTYR